MCLDESPSAGESHQHTNINKRRIEILYLFRCIQCCPSQNEYISVYIAYISLRIISVYVVHTHMSFNFVVISWPIQLKSSNVGIILNLCAFSTNKKHPRSTSLHPVTSGVRVQLVLTVVSCAAFFFSFLVSTKKM